MKYEIQIGTIYDCSTNGQKPKQTIIITEEQFQIIEHFAIINKDKDSNKVYKLNDCEFKISLHFDIPTRSSVLMGAEKPPIGLKPKWIHNEHIVKEIQQAMLRYAEKNKPFPKEWVEEYNSLVSVV